MVVGLQAHNLIKIFDHFFAVVLLQFDKVFCVGYAWPHSAVNTIMWCGLCQSAPGMSLVFSVVS